MSVTESPWYDDQVFHPVEHGELIVFPTMRGVFVAGQRSAHMDLLVFEKEFVAPPSIDEIVRSKVILQRKFALVRGIPQYGIARLGASQNLPWDYDEFLYLLKLADGMFVVGDDHERRVAASDTEMRLPLASFITIDHLQRVVHLPEFRPAYDVSPLSNKEFREYKRVNKLGVTAYLNWRLNPTLPGVDAVGSEEHAAVVSLLTAARARIQTCSDTVLRPRRVLKSLKGLPHLDDPERGMDICLLNKNVAKLLHPEGLLFGGTIRHSNTARLEIQEILWCLSGQLWTDTYGTRMGSRAG